MEIECMACGHIADVAGEVSLANDIFRCEECGARMAYGQLAPRIVVEPARAPQPMCRIRIQDAKTKADVHVLELDPQYAAMLAKNILSLVVP